jgi:bifunctional DNA-binding transcriptional regulator/antitoxin component of YhaV-PrlF toxin-antitoxin module
MKRTVLTRIDNHGRLVISSEIREELQLKDGERVEAGIQDGKVVLLTPRALLEESYQLTRNDRSSEAEVAQELIDERRSRFEPAARHVQTAHHRR